MLDDMNIINGRDKTGRLGAVADEYLQASEEVIVMWPEHDGREIKNVVLACAHNEVTAAEIVKSWLVEKIYVQLDVLTGSRLPRYVGEETLFIAVDHSGNTEEVAECMSKASERGAQTAIVTEGGVLFDRARQSEMATVKLGGQIDGKLITIGTAKAIAALLLNFGVVGQDEYGEFGEAGEWLKMEASEWSVFSDMSANYAKQLAVETRSEMCTLGSRALLMPLAQKWVRDWNMAGQNTTYWHLGDKPTRHEGGVTVAFWSALEDTVSSGADVEIGVLGDTVLKQALWVTMLGDYVTTYLAIMNDKLGK